MIKLTVYYTDGTETEYVCEKVRYDARVIFAETGGGERDFVSHTQTYM